jgi:hypothetical protein
MPRILIDVSRQQDIFPNLLLLSSVNSPSVRSRERLLPDPLGLLTLVVVPVALFASPLSIFEN